MPTDLLSALVGAGVAFTGGLGGVYLGHRFTSRRDAIERSITGLGEVISELGKLNRIGLYFEQRINGAKRAESDPEKLFDLLFDTDWMAATHELQESTWLFPCMAYLPDAEDDFRRLCQLMGHLMNPYSEPTEPGELTRDQTIEEFGEVIRQIRSQVEARLRQLMPKGA